MKKLLAICAVGALAFAACGDDDDDTTDTTEAPAVEMTEAPGDTGA